MFETQLKCFDTPECYFKSLPIELNKKRDFMVQCLKSIGMKPIIPQGGFFLIADWTPLGTKNCFLRTTIYRNFWHFFFHFLLKTESRIDLSSETDQYKDYRFAKWITKNVGVHGIPPSAFVSNGNKKIMENFIRFCFFKKPEKLQQCAEVLEKWAKSSVWKWNLNTKCTIFIIVSQTVIVHSIFSNWNSHK